MGAQAFGTDSLHLDMTAYNAIGDLDSRSGIIEVDSGATWPHLMEKLEQRQPNEPNPWCIVQKQTGADQLTLGGAIAANIHGRGLKLAPIVQDIESLTLLTATGGQIECSRTKNADWFSLVIGGYGLFGVVTSVKLRLMRRQILRRQVLLETIDGIPKQVEAQIRAGALYGDFQFSPAADTDGFLREGVFSVYHPVDNSEAAKVGVTPAAKQVLSMDHWTQLIVLAHTDKPKAFKTYLDYYRTTDGQLYESDRQQLSTYLPDYHNVIAEAMRPKVDQSLIITELYVPRDRLVDFFDVVRRDMLEHQVDLVYGVVRWIEGDKETFLPWARQRFACVIFNLNVQHSPSGKAKAAADFRRLIDRSLELGGSYYLTYHKYAAREQVERAYPNFEAMLAEKTKRDPAGLLQSDWFRHYQRLFDRR